MAAHGQKCHDWRLFIAATAPGHLPLRHLPRSGPDTPMSLAATAQLGALKVAIRDTGPPRSLPV